MPPLLLIDAGNTRTKWLLTRASHLTLADFRRSKNIATATMTFAQVQALAKKHPLAPVVLSSVVPRLTGFFRRAFGRRLFIVTGNALELGLKFDYPKPAEIGADRLASAVAAYSSGDWPVIIVNCGTATAFTVLNAKGELCGGVIAAGLQTQLHALLGQTAQLPKIELRSPRDGFLARNTHDAIRGGVLLSFQGGVQEIIAQLGVALNGKKKPRVILTGGNAAMLGKGITALRDPLLVFRGLRIIGDRVFSPTAS